MIALIDRPRPAAEAAQMNPMVLAYVGDAVYELFVRTRTVGRGGVAVLHGLSTSVVCAQAQAQAARRASLLPDEEAIFRRARNAKQGTVPKNASLADYCLATAIEAVVGYLYLTGANERLKQLMDELLAGEEET